MLKILRASEPVNLTTVVVMGYGEIGSGKTSLGFTAHDPLLLDFDRGAHRSGFRRDSVPIESWADVDAMEASDFAPYRTIVIDTAGAFLESMAAPIAASGPKMRNPSGGLSQQGFGALKTSCAAWFAKVRGYGKDIVVLGHAIDKKKPGSEDSVLRPDMMGGSYEAFVRLCDGIAHLGMSDADKRILDWSPRGKKIGKNPSGFDPMEVPDFNEDPHFLGNVIDLIKARIGQISAAGIEIRGIVDGYRGRIDGMSKADVLTDMVAEAKAIEGPAMPQVKALIAQRAKAIGLHWTGAAFEPKPTETAKAPQPADDPESVNDDAVVLERWREQYRGAAKKGRPALNKLHAEMLITLQDGPLKTQLTEDYNATVDRMGAKK